MNYGQRFVTLYKRQGSRPSPRKRNTKSQNGCLRLFEEALQIAEKRREAKGKGEKERYNHFNAELQRTIRKPSLVISSKKQRKTIEWERL